MTLIAIDGRAGAGKTTLAQSFLQKYSATKSVAVVHMDDLYDGWENALNDHLTQRLHKIITAHQNHQAIEVEIFNWNTMVFDSTTVIDPVDILILEGVGAGQQIVRDAGAELYWLDIDAQIGIARVLVRDGQHLAERMQQWEIEQENHFLRDKTRENAEHILSTP